MIVGPQQDDLDGGCGRSRVRERGADVCVCVCVWERARSLSCLRARARSRSTPPPAGERFEPRRFEAASARVFVSHCRCRRVSNCGRRSRAHALVLLCPRAALARSDPRVRRVHASLSGHSRNEQQLARGRAELPSPSPLSSGSSSLSSSSPPSLLAPAAAHCDDDIAASNAPINRRRRRLAVARLAFIAAAATRRARVCSPFARTFFLAPVSLFAADHHFEMLCLKSHVHN